MITRRFRKPYRIRKKKSILRNRFFWLGIIIIIVVGAIFYFLFFSKTFQIKQTIITGEEKVSEENLKLLIEKRLENRILFFKTRSLFLVNLNGIKNDILDNFSQIAEVKISQNFPDTINIIVVERLDMAIWCQTEHCFLLDKKGVIFDLVGNDVSNKIENVPGEIVLTRIIDRRDMNSFNLGDQIIEEDVLASIFDIKKHLKGNLEIGIKEFVIPNSGRLNVKTAEDWEIYFNLQKDVSWQLTKLTLVLKEEIPLGERENLDYIDLRFTRVYYKYKAGD